MKHSISRVRQWAKDGVGVGYTYMASGLIDGKKFTAKRVWTSWNGSTSHWRAEGEWSPEQRRAIGRGIGKLK